MNQAAHTPAPWKAHKTSFARSGLPEFEIHWSADGECVAEIVHGEADARLIAAAPELLDALAEAIEDFANGYAPDHPFLVKMRALYAKATGSAK